MRAAVVTRFGSAAEALRVVPGWPAPRAPCAGEVTVSTRLAAVNPLDVRQRAGYARGVTRLPAVLGRELVGEVAAVGAGVRHVREGDIVFGALPPGAAEGAHRAAATVKAEDLAKVPEGVAPEAAAAAPFAALTAWRALFASGAAPLQSGERLLVLGGGGAVGLAATALAASRGCRVAAVAGERSIDVIVRHGADLGVVDYRDGRRGIKAAGFAPFDAVLDAVGGKEAESIAASQLRAGGRLITLHGGLVNAIDARGIVAGAAAALADLAVARARWRLTHGIDYRWAVMRPDDEALAEVAELLADGRLDIPVAETLPLEDVVRAHELVESGKAGGKVLLSVDG